MNGQLNLSTKQKPLNTTYTASLTVKFLFHDHTILGEKHHLSPQKSPDLSPRPLTPVSAVRLAAWIRRGQQRHLRKHARGSDRGADHAPGGRHGAHTSTESNKSPMAGGLGRALSQVSIGDLAESVLVYIHIVVYQYNMLIYHIRMNYFDMPPF